jgi:hypothetical protein
MTPRGERTACVAALGALWLLFLFQARASAIELDDWFQLRYWRDHALGLASLWAYARHNYLHYNPRLGEVFLAIVDGSRAVHLVATPLVQLAALATTFVLALGRWPRPTVRDLQLLLFLQTMIWLVIPIPGIMYFYRPYATNYVWAFTITLTLFVPYRLALATAGAPRRRWLAPLTLILGWAAGMCNEHTGPTAMVALAAFVYVAWRRRQLRAWMLTGLVGLYVGYPMLFFAPGQQVRYGGLATHATPIQLLAERGVTGGLAILTDFVLEARLGLLVFLAAVARFAMMRRRRRLAVPELPRRAARTAAGLAAAALAIVVTLVASPTATDRVLYASGVLLVAAFTVVVDHLFLDAGVRRVVVGVCVVAFGYHVVRYVETGRAVKAQSDQRLAILAATPPGEVAVVSTYDAPRRSRWQLGDDFVYHPWLAGYVGGELYDLARVDRDRRDPAPPPRLVAAPPAVGLPTYRQLQGRWWRRLLEARLGPRAHVSARGLFDDPRHRPLVVLDLTPTGETFVDGSPEDTDDGHVIRVTRASLPPRLVDAYVIGCGVTHPVTVPTDGPDDPRLPVDEQFCRGPFTAILCQVDRCWVAGWY